MLVIMPVKNDRKEYLHYWSPLVGTVSLFSYGFELKYSHRGMALPFFRVLNALRKLSL